MTDEVSAAAGATAAHTTQQGLASFSDCDTGVLSFSQSVKKLPDYQRLDATSSTMHVFEEKELAAMQRNSKWRAARRACRSRNWLPTPKKNYGCPFLRFAGLVLVLQNRKKTKYNKKGKQNKICEAMKNI